MLERIRDAVKARDLLVAWTGRTLRARYQQSALGWLWAIVQPAAQAAIFTLIFTHFVPIKTGETPYVLFVFAATVPWTLLALSLTDMTGCIVTNMALVTKISFPREALPVAAMLARLVDFAVAVVLLGGLLVYFRAPLSPVAYLYLPAILGAQLLLVLGLGLAGAAVNVFYRDVQPLLVLVVQIWFYASPVIYPVSTVPEKWRPYYFLNPMAGFLEAYRDVLLHGRLPGPSFGLAAAISLVIFLVGYGLFKRLEPQFADII
jgi:lipopolysaccharide transport system permease protein